jgi:hypothetical protein
MPGGSEKLYFQCVMACMGLATLVIGHGAEGLIVHTRQMTGYESAEIPPEVWYEWYVKPWHQDAKMDQVGNHIIS